MSGKTPGAVSKANKAVIPYGRRAQDPTAFIPAPQCAHSAFVRPDCYLHFITRLKSPPWEERKLHEQNTFSTLCLHHAHLYLPRQNSRVRPHQTSLRQGGPQRVTFNDFL